MTNPHTLDIPIEALEMAEEAANQERNDMKQEIQKTETNDIQPASDQSATVLQIIQQAAVNPNVDIDKMERLLEMQERIVKRDAEQAYNLSLAQMQPNLPAIQANGVGHNKTKYAKWEDIQVKITPILAEFGFALSFKTDVQEKSIIVTAILRHAQGHSDKTSLPLPSDGSGSKNAVQAVGSSVSYGKRYTATALLNLNVAGEDDDARLAGAGEVITQEQMETLTKLIDETGTDIEQFCKHMKVPALMEMPLNKYGNAEKLLQAKKVKQNG